ncbi:ferritin-like domain-containing protein [Roseomonas stagni]|uniref:Ferritin-like domain-containing protein n=1 Tax=Falsiroseomonas algicola TaxID=2716930 RepID=A0A6M1LES6_9PROT|nr:ferritin-like domain-containing protein [Falsiroseomonas algicola]NGM18783.1 ferritin-like domain-containing protein [Falsiroseomonas algicola]
MAEDFKSLMIEALQDAYSAETQLVEALPQMAEAAHSPTLRQAFEDHLTQTRTHVERLERAAELLDADPEGEECEAMEGLTAEAEEIMDDHDEGPVRDAALIGAAQKVEHYEIATYGTLQAMAKAAGMQEVADLFGQTLAEEKTADEKLTALAEREVNPAALAA